VRPAVGQLDADLTLARPLLRSLTPAVESLQETAQVGVPLIRQLEPALENVEEKIVPNLYRVSPESKHPLYDMIGSVFGNLALGGGYTAGGHFARLQGSLDTNTNGGIVPCNVDFSNADLLTCETLTQAFEQLLTPPVLGSGSPAQPSRLAGDARALAATAPQLADRLFKGIPALRRATK
jgi:hypothetical protein